MLDLAGYRPELELHRLRLLEPSFGEGQFLLAASERLLSAARRFGLRKADLVDALQDSIRGVEVHQPSFEHTQARLIELLTNNDLSVDQAQALARRWLHCKDFLLSDWPTRFDLVVGNPPYLRLEEIPKELLECYKMRYTTFYSRADLYIPFIEHSLNLLAAKGTLVFICANRWTKNKYGGHLREKIARGFSLESYIDCSQLKAFEKDVLAYPAITQIRRRPNAPTRVPRGLPRSGAELKVIVDQLSRPQTLASPAIHRVDRLVNNKDPWLLDAPEIIAQLRALEARFPCLEEAGVKVGIGVATGCDEVYIRNAGELPVEADRILPLAMAGDLQPEGLKWSGRSLLNPWLDNGELAPLEDYPRMAAYLRAHEPRLRARHTARKNPSRWYRTIDRVQAQRVFQPKLLIPDIKGRACVVYDRGHFYPHHNLYVLSSDLWDLQVLQTLLRSSITLAMLAAYSIRMSGGFMRFQAQYLRRIRLPAWDSLSPAQRQELRSCGSQAQIDALVIELYGLKSRAAAPLLRYAAKARVGSPSLDWAAS